jgi:hypothetical protein
MAQPTVVMREDLRRDVAAGSSTQMDFERQLAKYVSDDIGNETWVDSEQELATVLKGMKVSGMHLVKIPSSKVGDEHKAELDEGQVEDQEGSALPKREKRRKQKSSAKSLSRKVSKAPAALGLLAQRILDHSIRRQALYRSGRQCQQNIRLRNAVLELIARLVIQEANNHRPGDGTFETYRIRNLRLLPTERPTQEQGDALDLSSSMGPPWVGRTAATVSGNGDGKKNKTNGSTTRDMLFLSADVREGQKSHARLTDLSKGQIISMLGLHLVWRDTKHDEFLSYSQDILFLLIHALGRQHQRQQGITIQFINRDKATTLDGRPAAFYHALDIYNIFEVPFWPGWTEYDKCDLHPRKFTHEFLSHGIIKHDDTTLKQAPLEHLIRDGLFDIMPELYVSPNDARAGLYTEQVVCRRIGFQARDARPGEVEPPIYSYDECPRPISLTTDYLVIVRAVALNFLTIPEGTDLSTVEPPLHIFLLFLTLYRREKADPVLMAWIKERYNGENKNTLFPPTCHAKKAKETKRIGS